MHLFSSFFVAAKSSLHRYINTFRYFEMRFCFQRDSVRRGFEEAASSYTLAIFVMHFIVFYMDMICLFWDAVLPSITLCVQGHREPFACFLRPSVMTIGRSLGSLKGGGGGGGWNLFLEGGRGGKEGVRCAVSMRAVDTM